MKVYIICFLLSIGIDSYGQSDIHSFKTSYRRECKSIEAKLIRNPNSDHLNLKYGILCFKLCKYQKAKGIFIKIWNQFKDSPEYLRYYYHTELALRNRKEAQGIYYRYITILKNESLNGDYVIKYPEYEAHLNSIMMSQKSNNLDYFPFVLNNGNVKHLTVKDYKYKEPSDALAFKNYITNTVSFNNPSFERTKTVDQPERAEGFGYQAFCLNRAQDKIFITRYDGVSKKLVICISEKVDDLWLPFRILRFVAKNRAFNFAHPMLTKNEDKLVFASDMDGGQGGYDLWIADLTVNNEIKSPKNLGSKINTNGDECYPTLNNEYSFFFSSNGHFGYGALDIYKASLLENSTTEPINLGKGINSNRDDYGFFYNQVKKEAYYTSNRKFNYANILLDKIYKISIDIDNDPIFTFEFKSPFKNSIAVNTAQTPITNDLQEITDISSSKESVELYKIKNDIIEEKFTDFSDPRNLISKKNDAIVENKFWTNAKLLFKDYNIPIVYTYCRVISPKNEVVYSNYSDNDGNINLEVVESNEYTIEIPKFKTFIKNIVFEKNYNELFFPYVNARREIPVTKHTVPKKRIIKKKAITKKYVPKKTVRQSSKTTNNKKTKTIIPPKNILQGFN